MSDDQNPFINPNRSYLYTQGGSGVADGSIVQKYGDDPCIRPTIADDPNSSSVNSWSSIPQPFLVSIPNLSANTGFGIGDESEEESDMDDIAPNLALQVTAKNLAAVLRLNSDMMYLHELVQTYISFDNAYRPETKTKKWSLQASKHLKRIRRAIARVYEAKRRVRLRKSSGQSVIMDAASRSAAIIEAGEKTYLEDTVEGMTTTRLLTAIANCERSRFPR
ncbi:MAG: hypothetical protein Q9195_008583 [Heterodermia aff. obscurata]